MSNITKIGGGWVGRRLIAASHSNVINNLLNALGMTARLADKSKRCGGVPCYLPQCPRRKRTLKTLWKREECEILDVLHDARNRYRTRLKELHPDKGGTNAETAALNEVWSRIKCIFKRRGYVIE